ncbi:MULTISPECIES: Nramp family divalent metal transporter [unclassified Spirosoma]|uniref:Nramp family divalent metal transporter n=1 Tax=unclassified Spirosoma TaxID=2621999 RepID=UPI0009650592|nr:MULTISPECIES: Nramp family divalent metal transporter [unclassified Spirosoma]MBN8823649.1 Nramp family divalent metal transporter [Spirosoma sp.]OJW76796.1 MAG: divalent metal cation transporter [Spirosoma sp. 48-14]
MEVTNTSTKHWYTEDTASPLTDVHGSVHVPVGRGFFRTLRAYAGPGLMVAVGYMDPGNWATDIAGGAQFGYQLLSVVLISNLFAILLQHLALKLGIATGRDLAQACRDHFSRPVGIGLWLLAEIAIAACDLAEVIGSAIALNLLFGLPITIGVLITALDALLLLYLQNKGFQILERIVAGLIFLIVGCFGYELIVSQPVMADVAAGLIPRSAVVTNPGMLYIAIGILGATVMPHNLYLHSSIVQTRNYGRNDAGRKVAITFATIDSTVSLFLAFFINAAILVLSAAAFHFSGNQQVADIADAHRLLDPILGVKLAGILFAVALLASGQNSTLTGTLAGQIVMEGFLNLRLKPWVRRLVTRLVAIIPALIVAILYGERGTAELLVLSQVILSLQLSFAVIPLVQFTSDKTKMGRFVNPSWLKILSWAVALIIMGLNGYLLWDTLT